MMLSCFSRNQKAFSLVELLVVIAIVGLLSAVAVPAYREYILRAKVIEALSLLQKYKTEALSNYTETGKFFGENYKLECHQDNSGCPGDIKYIDRGTNNLSKSVWIKAAFKDDVGFGAENNQVLIFLKEEDGIINSYCGQWQSSTYIEPKYLPGGCKDENISALEGA